jgi:hypothetical protein
LQTAQADTQTKVCKRACFANTDKIVFKKFPNASKKIKIHRHTARQKQQKMTRKLNIDKGCSDTKEGRPAGNSVYVAIAGEVVNRRSVLLRNFVLNGQVSATNPLLHIHAKRYGQV